MHKTLLALLLGVGASLALAEGVLRIMAPQHPSWLDIYHREPGDPHYVVLPRLQTRVETGEGAWHVYTDALGRRIPRSERVSSPEAPALYVLGDSFTFGLGVEYEASFVGRLAERLGDSYRVENLAVPGHGPVQYRLLLESALEAGERPAAVLLVLFTGNDFHDCVWGKDFAVIDGALASSESPLRARLKRQLHLYRLLSKAYQRLFPVALQARGAPIELYREESWQEGELRLAYDVLRAELGRAVAHSERTRAPLVVAVIPTVEAVAAGLPEPPAGLAPPRPELPVEKALALLADLEIRAVDLTPALRLLGAKRAYLAHDRHLSAEGNAAVAGALWPPLRRALAIERSESHGPGR